MAVIPTKNPSSLKMRFDCGKDENGKTIVKSRTYSKVRPDATDEKVYIVADAMASLQEHILIEVAKIDNTTISA
ncbi:DUF1659 domain-containing protein [Romboutsia sp.]|uniref:DUF1659 domain-containing protein n=1 Tax=Romboutsia sp. TaxID=1965302 RepID=UPI002C719C54|nr:DUF1659 domain-containing protein [Romboutsia sp.]HSQ87407.1 DUF1659 domain-containing protein [Romboutsia sp.]